MATKQQMATIRARAYNETARAMARDGVTLSYEQADALGGEAIDWLHTRLGLRVEETDVAVEATPRQSEEG